MTRLKTISLWLLVLLSTQLKAQIPTNGLISHYTFDLGQAVSETDASLNGVVIGASADEDRFNNIGGALHFDGNNDYVILPTSVINSSMTELSIFCWIKKNDADLRSNSWIISANKQGSDDIRLLADHRLVAALDDAAQPIPEIVWNPHNYADGTWHLVGLTYDASGMKLYSDGVLVGTDTDSFNFFNPLNFYVGRRAIYGAEFFFGSMDDLVIYDRALTASEIQALKDAPNPNDSGTGDPGVTSYWQKTDDNIFYVEGNVGIGIEDPNSKLVVDGKINSEEVNVEIINGPDYVFEPDYDLRTLEETKAYIAQYKHLPEIPSAKEMEANGVDLGEMNMLLLKKIEELTLHQIQLLERLEQAEKELSDLKNE